MQCYGYHCQCFYNYTYGYQSAGVVVVAVEAVEAVAGGQRQQSHQNFGNEHLQKHETETARWQDRLCNLYSPKSSSERKAEQAKSPPSPLAQGTDYIFLSQDGEDGTQPWSIGKTVSPAPLRWKIP